MDGESYNLCRDFFRIGFFAWLIIVMSGMTVADKSFFVIRDILFVSTQSILTSKAPRQTKVYKTVEILCYQ